MSTTRFYSVLNTKTGEEAIVDAGNASTAIHHIVNGTFKATPTTPKELARLLEKGVKIQTAGKAAAAAQPSQDR
jgi:hypothetical protein